MCHFMFIFTFFFSNSNQMNEMDQAKMNIFDINKSDIYATQPGAFISQTEHSSTLYTFVFNLSIQKQPTICTWNVEEKGNGTRLFNGKIFGKFLMRSISLYLWFNQIKATWSHSLARTKRRWNESGRILECPLKCREGPFGNSLYASSLFVETSPVSIFNSFKIEIRIKSVTYWGRCKFSMLPIKMMWQAMSSLCFFFIIACVNDMTIPLRCCVLPSFISLFDQLSVADIEFCVCLECIPFDHINVIDIFV